MPSMGGGWLWLVIAVLFVSPAHADARYCMGSIFMGRVTSVQGDAQAQRFPVRQDNGEYRYCDVFMGRANGCQNLADESRFPVQQPDGAYRDCDIFMGRPGGCQGVSQRTSFPVVCG